MVFPGSPLSIREPGVTCSHVQVCSCLDEPASAPHFMIFYLMSVVLFHPCGAFLFCFVFLVRFRLEMLQEGHSTASVTVLHIAYYQWFPSAMVIQAVRTVMSVSRLLIPTRSTSDPSLMFLQMIDDWKARRSFKHLSCSWIALPHPSNLRIRYESKRFPLI